MFSIIPFIVYDSNKQTNILKTYLNTYDPICRVENCFVCINR